MADVVKRLDSLGAKNDGGPRSLAEKKREPRNMNQTRLRQLAQLEKLAEPLHEAQRQAWRKW